MDEGSSEPDIVEQGGGPRLPGLPSPGWRPSRGTSIVAAVALVAGLCIGVAVGYSAGHGGGRGTASATVAMSPSTPVGVSSPAVTEDPGTCSVQVGHDLELGIPVTNQSGGPVVLASVKPVLPLSGLLTVLSWRWAPCGFDGDGIVPDAVILGPGETAWVTALVRPLVTCPAPAPLQFQVTYSVNGHPGEFNLPGFPDLSAVHYSGCASPAG